MFNSEEYIVDCLRSVLGQTYTALEVICVNDGSTDATELKAASIINDDCRAHILRQGNQGPSAARNNALQIAQGDYILFLDADDMLATDAVKQLVDAAQVFGAQIVASGFSEEESFRNAIRIGSPTKRAVFEKATIEDFFYQSKITNHACAKLYHRTLFDDGAIRYPIGRTYEDVSITYLLMQRANCVAYTKIPLYYYRPNEHGITHTYSEKNVCDYVLAYTEAKRMLGAETDHSRHYYLLTMLYTLLRLIDKAGKSVEMTCLRRKMEAEYDNAFDLRILNFRKNCIFSLKLLICRLSFGKKLLATLRK